MTPRQNTAHTQTQQTLKYTDIGTRKDSRDVAEPLLELALVDCHTYKSIIPTYIHVQGTTFVSIKLPPGK